MMIPPRTVRKLASAVPARQGVRGVWCRGPVRNRWRTSAGGFRIRFRRAKSLAMARSAVAWPVVAPLMFLSVVGTTPVSGQLADSLDAYPPRWILADSDCGARVITHNNLPDGGVDGRGCESIAFMAGRGGTEVLLTYPIEPVRPLDDLTANVSVMTARTGARIGFRVRFPYLESSETRRPVSAIVYGASYTRAGTYQTLGVGKIERALSLKQVALRKEHGVEADLSDAYVDAVVINAYSGPGRTNLRIDNLRVGGMIEIGRPDGATPRGEEGRDDGAGGIASTGTAWGAGSDPSRFRVSADALRRDGGPSREQAFPVGRVTRILQHNGEPLEWVRTLGFDAVLLSRPPDAATLREAISARLMIYAPPPAGPDPELEPLLDPVAGWYLGTGTPLDGDRVGSNAELSERLRRWPRRWQRPLIGSPLEAYRDYALQLDAVIQHLPPRNRGISGEEEIQRLRQIRQRLPQRVQRAVGVASMPPESLIRQTDAIAGRIGAEPLSRFRWHAMWVQAVRSLEACPDAILVRSTRSLSSATPLESQRAMAMSYVNRMIAAVEPWAAAGQASTPPVVRGANYRCGRIRSGDADLLILTSAAARGSEVLSGDGQALALQLSAGESSNTVWRLSHFSAERLSTTTDETGSRVEIVSPDVVEVLLMSQDVGTGGRAGTHASRFARQATLDRWQLTNDSVSQTVAEWSIASAAGVAGGVAGGGPPGDLADVARRTLRDAEPAFRAGDFGTSLRMARRADAWGLRSRWRLAERLMPDWPHPTSVPPMDCGAAEVQTTWFPLMSDQGWGKNRLPTGGLDDAEALQPGRWEVGRRLAGRAEGTVDMTRRDVFAGDGALQARVVAVTEDGLPGGYEGTTIQIRSPGVRAESGTAVRIDAMVRTVGFGEPHQGLLVYDTVGGQEAGVLVRGASEWTPVRLYRQTLDDFPIHVMFELIGAGEATIDEVQMRVWEPDRGASPIPRPLQPPTRRRASDATN